MNLNRNSILEKIVELGFLYLFLILTSFLVLFPLVIIISSSFKNELEIFSYPISIIPENITFENFLALVQNFPLYIFNSFKVTTIITVVQIFTALTGGYALSKLKWRGRDLVFILYISSIMIPFQVYIIPQFIIIRTMGLYNTHLALILVSSFTAFGIFLVRQFFLTIPDSYVEAAKIYGAGHFYIFIKIMLPLSKPVIATLTILSFRYWWNDLFTPLIYITSKHLKTLPLGLADFVSEFDVYYGPQMAASIIAIIPVVLLYIVAQKYIVKSVVFHGVKA
jgi:multiple sugar transport system permease protein